MRIVLIIAAMLITGAAFSQAKPQQPAKDTAWIPKTDTTEFISTADLNALLLELSNNKTVTPKEFLEIQAAFNQIIARAIDRKRKKQ